ncbi:Intracellular serine protease-like protein [Cladobotryum mycophilum]|uniref:Intracellular serine protease-like protein n=1 Tax=Cladobotryum mycophilum TaxID=491253 RepID=A0ABR0SLE0_9HYPO
MMAKYREKLDQDVDWKPRSFNDDEESENMTLQKLGRAPTRDLNRRIPLPMTLRESAHLDYQANEARQYAPQSSEAHRKAIEDAKPFEGSQIRKRHPKSSKSAGTHSPRLDLSGPLDNSSERPSCEVADTVAKELKLHYLRSIFHQKSDVIEREFLFGDNRDDKQICFDFPPYVSHDAEEIDFQDFEASYKGLKFDEVLQYVDFRGVRLHQRARTSRSSGASSLQGIGRNDMVKFFDWLWGKGVRNIIKVIVEEGKDGFPHNDEAIETALKRFNVEILDWRKVDLDPRTIRDACQKSDLRELHLRWSGSNGILRAWSEPEGLAKIHSLQQIYLHEMQNGLESRTRTERNLTEFKSRLDKTRDAAEPGHILINHERLGEPNFAKPMERQSMKDSTRRNQMDTYRWLSIMDRFADGISSLEPLKEFPADYLTDPSLPHELQRDVEVVLIDDGVNFMHRAVADKIEIGRSFDSGYYDLNQSGTPEPFHGSTTGHGTYMAYMIGRVCPGVKIYVCKLNVMRREGGEKANFTAKSAADAVEFTVNRGFDIISMSWTVQKSEDNAKDITRLQEALERAVKEKILIFCSAPDIGRMNDQIMSSYYPFGCSSISNDIFKIGVAKADGSTYSWTGHSHSVDFILPGHNVQLRKCDRIMEEDDTPKTGSSVATALAAGLAALIIHYVRLGAIYNHFLQKHGDPNAVSENSVRIIKRSPAMKEAFMKVSSRYAERDRKDNNLEVESFFKDPSEFIHMESNTSDEAKWAQITQLARDLVSSNMQSRAMSC